MSADPLESCHVGDLKNGVVTTLFSDGGITLSRLRDGEYSGHGLNVSKDEVRDLFDAIGTLAVSWGAHEMVAEEVDA